MRQFIRTGGVDWIAAVLTAGLMIIAPSPSNANEVKPTFQQRCLDKPYFQRFPNPAILQKVGRGFNLPNWDFSDPREAPEKQTLKELYKRGMGHIRLPVYHENLHAELRAADYLNELSNSIKILTEIGYVVSVDFHPGSEFGHFFESDPRAGFSQLEAIWQELTKVIATFPANRVLAELWNEPEISEGLWNEHLPKIFDQVRQALPDHTIVVGPSGAQRPERLPFLPDLQDPNVLYAFHFYDPLFFTHQGADWHSAEDPVRALRQIPFPTSLSDREVKQRLEELTLSNPKAAQFLREQIDEPWGTQDLRNTLDVTARWGEENEKILVLNEFGVLSHHAPFGSRLFWITNVRTQVEARCIGWTHWEYQHGFGFVDPQTGKADEAMLQGLLSQ